MTYQPLQTPTAYSTQYLSEELNKIRLELEYLRSRVGTQGSRSNQDYVWDDYTTSGLAVSGGVNAPSLGTFIGNHRLYEFPANLTKDVHATTHILHGIKPGTDMYFHVHYSTNQTASATQTIIWQGEWTIARGYGAGVYVSPASPSVSCGTFSITSTVAIAPFVHHITNETPATIPYNAELEVDSVLLLRLFRDPTHPSDTYDRSAYLIQADFHYQKDRLGTIERNRPFASWR